MTATVDLRGGLDARGLPRQALVAVDLAQVEPDEALASALAQHRDGIVVGVSDEPLPDTPGTRALLDGLDVLLAPSAPGSAHAGGRADLAELSEVVEANPVAAVTLKRVLRAGEGIGVDAALTLESLAYSTLLAGSEFRGWLGARDRRAGEDRPQRVEVERPGAELVIRLARPWRRNAVDAAMRDALHEALEVALLDPSVEEVVLRGDGPDFSAGGDLDEFGSAADVAVAALVRTSHSVARSVHDLGPRLRCEVQGACVGAGIEIPSFAAHVTAAPDAWFQLPEVRMGLVPGAGGTVGIPRRIGRWRTAYMALTAGRIDATTALAWGLVDECTGS
ncbi:enoyl-CoA hydratase/isomerase family protein [Nocardioides zeae]|uniref:enoyl-CoA hydratase/isomerase family protein n=1 Tax=Nocardioides zeae TaxID=1457234 RepID=UPI00286ABD59|nr:enoyl-CoA hydratase/isomerase family protein [Nocardioides zeae]